MVLLVSTPRGIRIPVTSVKGKCPRPLDDGGIYGCLLCNTIFSYGGFYNESLRYVNKNFQMKEVDTKDVG